MVVNTKSSLYGMSVLAWDGTFGTSNAIQGMVVGHATIDDKLLWFVAPALDELGTWFEHVAPLDISTAHLTMYLSMVTSQLLDQGSDCACDDAKLGDRIIGRSTDRRDFKKIYHGVIVAIGIKISYRDGAKPVWKIKLADGSNKYVEQLLPVDTLINNIVQTMNANGGNCNGHTTNRR